MSARAVEYAEKIHQNKPRASNRRRNEAELVRAQGERYDREVQLASIVAECVKRDIGVKQAITLGVFCRLFPHSVHCT